MEVPVSTSNIVGSIFFQGDRIYGHKIFQLNYTTYDVCRAQDIVNPGTSHCNIMLLASSGPIHSTTDDPLTCFQTNHFLYAKVIGIYHANMIYTGPGMLSYTPRRMDFLGVWWYEHQEGKTPARLDRLSFPPITTEEALGFVNPADVVRSCHIIPRFSKGKQYPSGIGYSRLAHNSCIN